MMSSAAQESFPFDIFIWLLGFLGYAGERTWFTNALSPNFLLNQPYNRKKKEARVLQSSLKGNTFFKSTIFLISIVSFLFQLEICTATWLYSGHPFGSFGSTYFSNCTSEETDTLRCWWICPESHILINSRWFSVPLVIFLLWWLKLWIFTYLKDLP